MKQRFGVLFPAGLCLRFKPVLGLVLLLICSPGLPAEESDEKEAPSSVGLDRWRLMQFRDTDGGIFPVTFIEDWEERRKAVLEAMQMVMGPLPGKEKRTALRAQVHSEEDAGSYLRRLISYSPEPKGRTPAYLLIPKVALEPERKLPGVLALHPTDHELGMKVAVGLGGKPGRDYGHELAERGYVVIAPAYPLLADYQPALEGLGYASGTMKAVWDNIRALDLLETLPFVKSGNFGAIGHSLGGHNALFTAAFDERIKVVVSSCGFDSFADYKGGDIRGWTSERYMPRLAQFSPNIPFDFPEVIAAIAPRVCFVSAPFYDDNFSWRSVMRIEEAAGRVYQLYGARDHLVVHHPRVGHEFPEEMREAAYQMFERWLK
jgi:dienelactone hydrolase